MNDPATLMNKPVAQPIDSQTRGYIICAMPRSGSYYLCDLLTSTGVLGRPSEYLNPDTLRFLQLPIHADDPRERARQALRLGTTDNGIYGIKVLAHHFDHYTYGGWLDDLPNRSFVFLTRDDVLGQALSLARAQQTQQWTSAMPSARPDRGVYDCARIQHCISSLVLDEGRWRAFFARNGISPLRATYEELLANPQHTVSRLARTLGFESQPSVDSEQLTFKVQRDDTTDAWRERFLSENVDLGYLDSNGLSLQSDRNSVAAPSSPRAIDKFIVWGAGLEASHVLRQRFDLSSIDFFIDSDPEKHGQTFLGLPIRPPEALLDESDRIVLISSDKNASAIRHSIDSRFARNVRRIVTFDDLLLDPRASATS